MNYKEIIPYKLRRALSMATIAGATLMPASCAKVGKEEPTRDVEIEFDGTNSDKKLDMKVLQELVNDKTVRCVYMTATDHWRSFTARNISQARTNFFQPRIEMSPKMRGRGDFDFKLGEASKVPTDSLWYVQQGWTINKKYQK